MSCQHPGKVLQQQYLEPQNLSQNKLARAIKVPPRRINEIIHGKRGVTADTAVRLALYFGGSAIYWLHLQAEYEIEKVRQNISIQLNTIQSTVLAPTTPVNTTAQAHTSNTRTGVKKRIMR